MHKNMNDLNRAMTQIYKEEQQLYHDYALSCGMSSTTIWLLYALSEQSGPVTQAYISSEWCISKQTLNSCLKQLQSGEYVELKPSEENRKNKMINVTEKGTQLIKDTALILVELENQALQEFSVEECELLVKLSSKRVKALKELVDKNIKAKKGDTYENRNI